MKSREFENKTNILGIWVALIALLLVQICCYAPAYATLDVPVVVSLGDSYSSGEGNPPFYGSQHSSNDLAVKEYSAHRSKKSWPGQLVVRGYVLSKNKETSWFFRAVSGAEVRHVASEEQPKTVDTLLGSAKSYDLPPQISVFDEENLRGRVDYVTITIGGNDMGFADVIAKTAMNCSYVDRSYIYNICDEAWKKFDNETKEALEKAYRQIRDAAGPQVEMIVAGYPTLLCENREPFNWIDDVAAYLEEKTDIRFRLRIFDDFEAEYINANVRRFNAEIELIVKNARLSNGAKFDNIHFVSVEEGFAGKEVGSDDPYIHGIQFILGSDDIVKSESNDFGGFVSPYSFHPNKRGMRIYAEAVGNKIVELEETKYGDEPENLDEVVNESSADESVVPDDQKVKENDSDSSSQDIVLVLDRSGSMAGDPLEQTKEASYGFVDEVLGGEVNVGIVVYDDVAETISAFSQDIATLKQVVSEVQDAGGTNMESGLLAAESMLAASSADERIIVLMSDGEPNDGKTGEDLIAYADSLKRQGIRVFTLGFNESAQGQALLTEIADEGYHYEVQDASDLNAFFADIANVINGTRFIYARIACPVDVSVVYDGETLSSAGDASQTRTSFGSLSFEEEVSEDGTESEEQVKVLRLVEGPSYEISIEGTGEGSMDYTIGFVDEEGSYDDFRSFSNIPITKSTLIDTTAEVSDVTHLSIDEDGDGRVDIRYRAEANSEARRVDNSWVVYSVLAGFAFLFVLCASLYIRSKVKRHLFRRV